MRDKLIKAFNENDRIAFFECVDGIDEILESLSVSMPLCAVIVERNAQKRRGYDEAHDDAHDKGELAVAAAYFAMFNSQSHGTIVEPCGRPLYAFDDASFLRRCAANTRRENLVKAAALLLAEIERVDRANGS